MIRIRTGFARTDDGQQLYYRSCGEGPALVCCNGVGVSTFFFKYVVAQFSPTHQVVVWDYRGHGRSTSPADPSTADLSIERNARDLVAVLDALHLSRPAVLLGHSMGCQVILETALQHPDRVAGLIPLFGTFGRPLDTFMDWPHSRAAFDLVKSVADRGGKLSSRVFHPLTANPLALPLGRLSGFFDRFYADPVDLVKYLEHLEQMDARVFLRMVSFMADHDAGPRLADIQAPTLVIAGERDNFTPLHRSKLMAERIPGAELLILAEASHAAIIEEPDTIFLRVQRFLRERVRFADGPPQPADQVASDG